MSVAEPRLLPGDALVDVCQGFSAHVEFRLHEREVAQGLIILLFCLYSRQHGFHQLVSLLVPPRHVEDESLVLRCRHVGLPHCRSGAGRGSRRHVVEQPQRVASLSHAAQRRSHVQCLLGVVARQPAEDVDRFPVFANEQVEVGHVEHDVAAAWRRRPHHPELLLIIAERLAVVAKLLVGVGEAAVEQLAAVPEQLALVFFSLPQFLHGGFVQPERCQGVALLVMGNRGLRHAARHEAKDD